MKGLSNFLLSHLQIQPSQPKVNRKLSFYLISMIDKKWDLSDTKDN